MEIETHAKNAAAVLAAVSTLAYVSGYLALRARANALGTDPSFTLVDEGYVFAGFRFFFISLIVLLLLSPIILALRRLFIWSARRLPSAVFVPSQWVLLAGVVIGTLLTLRILGQNSLLLQTGADSVRPLLQETIMGGKPAMSIVLTASTLLLAVLSVLWLVRSYASMGRCAFIWILGAVVALQLLMLPIYHGVLFAERKVRLLAAGPDTVKTILPPLGIVDRTSNHYTLLGRGADGRRLLTTVKRDDLNGIPIEGIVTLKTFLDNHLGDHGDGSNSQGGKAILAQARQPAPNSGSIEEKNAQPDTAAQPQSGFFDSLVNQLQMTFETIGSLSESAVDAGELWSVAIDASGNPSAPQRVGSLDDLAWPVAGPDGKTVYALQQGRVVRIGKAGNAIEVLGSESRWVKLLGVAGDHTVLGLLFDGHDTRPAAISPAGRVTIDRARLSAKEETRLSLLLQEARSYAGGRALLVDRSLRGGRGFDVFMKSADRAVPLSDCGDDRCGQPSLSPDLKRILFIRQPR